MLLQETPPDTSLYMIAGYAIFSLIMAIYLLSLFLRRRNLDQDLNTLESIRAANQALEKKAAPSSTGRSKTTGAKASKRRGVGRKVTRKKQMTSDGSPL
jgi:hypothetical protein